MVSEKEIERIAHLADIGISAEEVAEFTPQFNAILEYFDTLDQVQGEGGLATDIANVWRDDEVVCALPQEEVLANAGASEEGFIKGPRVM